MQLSNKKLDKIEIVHSVFNSLKYKTQVTRLRDTQTYNQANPSVFHIQRNRVQTRQNREHVKNV